MGNQKLCKRSPYNASLKLSKTYVKYCYFNMLYKMLNKLPGSMWDIVVIFRKIKTILNLFSCKRYFSHPEKSILYFTLENLCTRTAQSSLVFAVDGCTKYTILAYCDPFYEPVLYSF